MFQAWSHVACQEKMSTYLEYEYLLFYDSML